MGGGGGGEVERTWKGSSALSALCCEDWCSRALGRSHIVIVDAGDKDVLGLLQKDVLGGQRVCM